MLWFLELITTRKFGCMYSTEAPRTSIRCRGIAATDHAMAPPAQVILDVGAQVLELTNAEVENEWLRLASNSDMPQAVIFCDDNDDLSVMDRKGRIESLQTSPFAKQLDVCYVFLDEAHTRGTDLKLPEHYRAAVTLGANLTKDRLVHACMRMRRLGQGQSVVFCVPDEIRQKITTRASDNGNIEVSDVLFWAISETWQDMKRNIPLWATQGLRFLRHERLWKEIRTQDDTLLSSNHVRRFLEDEALSLEQRYRPRANQDGLADFIHSDQSQAASLIATRCREFGSVSYHSAKMDEEQEREVAAEAEREQQVQRPPKARPKKHEIHEDMKKLVSTGVIAEGSTAFLPAFRSLDKTSAARHPGVDQFPGKLLVTRDYAQTVEPIDILSFSPDFFQRPVQWILTSRHGSNSTDHKPTVNQSHQCSMYTSELHYRAEPVRRAVVPEFPMGEDSVVATDSFILRRDKNNRAERLASTFRQSPIKFLKVLMSQVRRKGEGIGKTHMGKIFNGIILHRSDFEEPRRAEQDQVLSD
ncbi:hypothetical protein RU639_002582 [Aspergillus parasiticus]